MIKKNKNYDVNIMDALKIREIKWSKKMPLEKLHLTLTGYSRAAYRTGFYIPELDLMLDAGPTNFHQPKTIFITHTHGDHIAHLPFTLIKDENSQHTDIYAPPGSKPFLDHYIMALFTTNAMSTKVSPYKYQCHEVTPGTPEELERANSDTGTNPGILELTINKAKYSVQVIKCDHSLPTNSYLFRIVKSKLRPEYHGLNGKEIVALKKQQIQITEEVFEPQFAFICDTAISTITQYETQIMRCPYVIVECTFLEDTREELEQARKKQHIHWQELRPYVIKHPEVIFILIHFSCKYKDTFIQDFFAQENLPNVRPHLMIN